MMLRTHSHALAAAALILSAAASPAVAQSKAADPLAAEIETRMTAVMPKVVAWRRDIHEHPELSNQETRTAALVEKHLRALGLEVQPNVGKTGVIGILRGGKPGPVVALRADMDALPVTELVNLPFKSTVRTMYNGQEVGVMHACGHDNHVAIMMGTAEVLAGMKERIPGTVKFIFQPAEEGLGGAEAMIADGALQNPRPTAIFGLHVWPSALGSLSTRAGGFMAAADNLDIVVKGRQTHGSQPWSGVDPIVIAASIVTRLQTLVSRELNPTDSAVVTVGSFQAGSKHNIMPDEARLQITVRSYEDKTRQHLLDGIRRIARAEAMPGVVASVASTALVCRSI